jgi:hypothetical protein
MMINIPVMINNNLNALLAGSIFSSLIPAGTFLEKWNKADS